MSISSILLISFRHGNGKKSQVGIYLLNYICLDITSESLELSPHSTLHLRRASGMPTLPAMLAAYAATGVVFRPFSRMLFVLAYIGSRVFHVSSPAHGRRLQMSCGRSGRCVDRIHKCGRPKMTVSYGYTITCNWSIGQSYRRYRPWNSQSSSWYSSG